MQHTIALLNAAKATKTSFRADLYDGSEKGEKVYDTVAAIGRVQAAGTNRQLPQVKNAERLDGIKGWSVSIAYFEPGSGKQDALPVYELSFLMFENGVSRKLYIDYGEFALQGDLTEITFHPPVQVRRTKIALRATSRTVPSPTASAAPAHAAGIAPARRLTVICARSAKM